MAIRLNDLNDYSTAVALRPALQPLVAPTVPVVAATQALMRRGENGLALSEIPGNQPTRRVRLNGLGELVQVVT
jgi:hypothetical protein